MTVDLSNPAHLKWQECSPEFQAALWAHHEAGGDVERWLTTPQFWKKDYSFEPEWYPSFHYRAVPPYRGQTEPQPNASPVNPDAAGEACAKTLDAIREERLWQAALAVFPTMSNSNPNLPGDPAGKAWPDPDVLAQRRAAWAVLQAEALLAAFEAHK